MAKLSQKELINEGVFKNILRGVAKTALQGVKGAAKGAVKMITPTGYNVLTGGVNKTKQIGKNIKQNFATTGDQLTDILYQRGLVSVGDVRGDINNQGTVTVAELEYTPQGKPTPGKVLSSPIVFVNKDGTIKIVRGPTGHVTSKRLTSSR
jgi:hypothetical protein